jgi:hypothetical protein
VRYSATELCCFRVISESSVVYILSKSSKNYFSSDRYFSFFVKTVADGGVAHSSIDGGSEAIYRPGHVPG